MNQGKTFFVTPLPPALSKPCHLLYTPPKTHTSLRELAQTKPKEALNQLLDSKSPELANLKAYALLKLKKLRAAQKAIQENYMLYPDNLSVRINYADLCLRKRRWRNIPQIFPSHDLRELYPEQEVFPASEFLGFMVLMGYYHLKLKQRELAEQFYVLAVKADPLHPSVAALEKKLFPKNLFGRIFGSW